MFTRKTKDQNFLKVIWFPLGAILTFLVVFSTAGPKPALYTMGGLMFIASLFAFLTFWRTRNSGYLAVTMWFGFVALVCVSAPPAIDDKSKIGLIPFFIVGMYVMMLIVAYLGFNRKLKWRGQEVFELAAMPVEDTGDSFTARPRPAGQVPISKTEMIRFVDFVVTKLIAFAFPIIFVMIMERKFIPLEEKNLEKKFGNQYIDYKKRVRRWI